MIFFGDDKQDVSKIVDVYDMDIGDTGVLLDGDCAGAIVMRGEEILTVIADPTGKHARVGDYWTSLSAPCAGWTVRLQDYRLTENKE